MTKEKQPTKRHKISVMVLFALLAIIVLKTCGSKDDTPKISIAQCKLDIDCWAPRHEFDAKQKCWETKEAALENLVRFDDERSDWPTFKTMLYTPGSDVIEYITDNSNVINEFGIFVPVDMVCVYNTALKKVTDIRLKK